MGERDWLRIETTTGGKIRTMAAKKKTEHNKGQQSARDVWDRIAKLFSIQGTTGKNREKEAANSDDE